MNKKLGLDSYLRRIFIAATLTLLLCFTSFGQSKVDLEVKVQSASEAIGGEVFSLAVTVTNRGTVTATDVILLQTTRETTKSAVSSAGECSLSKDYSYIPFPFRCMLGDIRPDETKVINFEISIRDFGGEEVRLDNRRAMPALGSFAGTNGSANHTRDNSIGDIEVRAEEVEENYENNRADIVVLLLPSKNIPPRIEVVSPKSGTVFVAPLTKKIQIPLVIKSFDLDGSISKVTVSLSYMPSMRFLEDDGTFKYLIGGRKYTLAEFERLQQEAWEKLVEKEKTGTLEFPETLANASAKGLYDYIVKDYGYGENNIHICAYDDGGRSQCTTASFKVKSESEIKITTPNKTVLPPNSTIFIETTSKVTLGINAKVKLHGLNGENSYDDNSPLMSQSSRVGNTISHRFPWRQSKEGRYYIRTVLYENGESTNTEDVVEVIIAEPRVIKIFSLSNGQEFEEYKPIRIAVDAMDVKGNIVQDQLELIIDGKYKRTVYNARRTESSPTNKQVIDKEYFSTVSDLEKGVHTVQILARSGHYHRDGQILGKSEIINIIVK